MKIVFWQKLDTLLRHHLSLMDALEVMKKEAVRPAEKRFLNELSAKLHAGQPLSRAVGNEGLVGGILAAGERAGDLRGAVSRVAERLERQSTLRAQMIGATVYPALILLLCVALCAILSAVVLPRFEKLFISLGVADSLPAITRAMIAMGAWMREWGLWLLGVFIIAGVAAKLYLKGERAGRLLWHLPVVGRLWRTTHRESFFNTLALLLKSGTPMDEALRITGESMQSTPLGKVGILAAQRVKEGDSVGVALRASGAFEESQVEMISLSEHSGSVAESAGNIAALLQERLKLELKAAMTLLEPALIIFMSGIVAGMVVALFLPLGPLVTKLAGGG